MLLGAACSGSKETKPTPAPTAPSTTPSPTTAPPQPKTGPDGQLYGGTYRFAVSNEYAGLDPQIDTTLAVYSRSRDIFNTLVRYKGNTLELEPELVSAMPSVSADGKTYSFKLRDDVTFHNGAKLTAKDVKFTFERMLTPATKAKNGWVLEEIQGAKEMLDGKATELAGLKVTGDYTFEITLKSPYGPFLANLATPPASIFPMEYTKQAGAGFQRKPIGSGPFKLAEWKPNELIAFEKNPTYFEKGLPYLDKIEVRVIKDEATRWLEFQNGTFHDGAPPSAEFGLAIKSDKWTVTPVVTLNTFYLALNNSMVTDKRVREAISLAIDRGKLLLVYNQGKGTPAKGFTTPGIPGALTSAPGFKYDPERAKALLKEAGAVGMKLEGWQRGGDKPTDTNLALQQMLKDVGIDFQVKVADAATYRDARGTGKIPANFGNWFADFADPDNYLYTFFHSKSSKGYSVVYSNPDVDKVLEEARTMADQAKRQKMYQDLEMKLLYEEYAILPLFHTQSYSFTQKNVKGFLTHPTGVGGLRYAWFAK